MLAAGNAIGLALCLLALGLVMRFRSQSARDDAPASPVPVTVTELLDAPQAALAELHTTELDALRIVVLDAQQARRRDRAPVSVVN